MAVFYTIGGIGLVSIRATVALQTGWFGVVMGASGHGLHHERFSIYLDLLSSFSFLSFLLLIIHNSSQSFQSSNLKLRDPYIHI